MFFLQKCQAGFVFLFSSLRNVSLEFLENFKPAPNKAGECSQKLQRDTASHKWCINSFTKNTSTPLRPL